MPYLQPFNLSIFYIITLCSRFVSYIVLELNSWTHFLIHTYLLYKYTCPNMQVPYVYLDCYVSLAFYIYLLCCEYPVAYSFLFSVT